MGQQQLFIVCDHNPPLGVRKHAAAFRTSHGLGSSLVFEDDEVKAHQKAWNSTWHGSQSQAWTRGQSQIQLGAPKSGRCCSEVVHEMNNGSGYSGKAQPRTCCPLSRRTAAS